MTGTRRHRRRCHLPLTARSRGTITWVLRRNARFAPTGRAVNGLSRPRKVSTVDANAAELPVGYAARPATDDDASAILKVIHAYDIAVIGHPDYTLADVAADLHAPGLRPEHDTVVITDERAEIPTVVGWAWCLEEDGKAEADFYLHPDVPPESIGPWVVAWLQRRAAGSSVSVGNWSADHQRARWFADAGWQVVRTFLRMVIDLPPAATDPEPLARVVVAAVADDEPARRAVHRCIGESFRDHWDSTELTYDLWWEKQVAAAGHDPSLWWVAAVAGEPAAALLATTQMSEDSTGWIRHLGGRRDFRGQGLAKLLLRTAFAEFARRGWRHAELTVDTESPTGALRLYESVGMRQKHAIDVWRHEISTPLPIITHAPHKRSPILPGIVRTERE